MEGFDLRRLFTLQGRIDRSTFWLLTITNQIALFFVLNLMASVNTNNPVVALGFLVLLAFVLVIEITTPVKRWHDRGKSGWWILINLVPGIGQLWSLIETGFLPGTRGPNRYGPPNGGSPFGATPRSTRPAP